MLYRIGWLSALTGKQVLLAEQQVHKLKRKWCIINRKMQQPHKNYCISEKCPSVRSPHFMPNNSSENEKKYFYIHIKRLSPTVFIDKPHCRPVLVTWANLCKLKNYPANDNLLSLNDPRNNENIFIEVFWIYWWSLIWAVTC